MASITVTPLNNGITSAGTINGMLTLNSGTTLGYLYYDSVGDIYYQSDKTIPATLLLSAGFAITCADCLFDGMGFQMFLGGVGGNYVSGTVDTIGTSTLAAGSNGTYDFTAVAVDIMAWSFVLGDSNGSLHSFDINTSIITQLVQLTATGTPNGASLKVASIKYDLTTDRHLVVCIASTNANPDYANPVDVSAKAASNFSVVYYGNPPTLGDPNTRIDFVKHEFPNLNLPFCALGTIANSTGVKVPKMVVAGEDCKIYHSDTGTTWALTTNVDQKFQMNSLTFNSWVFVGGLLYGIVLMSTNGVTWESSFDASLYSDIVEVKPA